MNDIEIYTIYQYSARNDHKTLEMPNSTGSQCP